jgi:competence protein ComEA
LGQTSNTMNAGIDEQPTVNINTASESELDTLPGVGNVTAGKIISNRPYNALDELLSKKVVNTGVFEQIKDKITIY